MHNNNYKVGQMKDIYYYYTTRPLFHYSSNLVAKLNEQSAITYMYLTGNSVSHHMVVGSDLPSGVRDCWGPETESLKHDCFCIAV